MGKRTRLVPVTLGPCVCASTGASSAPVLDMIEVYGVIVSDPDCEEEEEEEEEEGDEDEDEDDEDEDVDELDDEDLNDEDEDEDDSDDVLDDTDDLDDGDDDSDDSDDSETAIEVPSVVIAEVSAVPSRRRRAAGRPAGPPIHAD